MTAPRPLLLPATVVALLALATPGAGSSVSPRCPDGRFVVASSPRPRRIPMTAIVVDGARIAIEGECDLAAGRLVRTATEDVMKARWRSCARMRRVVRLAVRIDAESCAFMRGTVRVGRRKAKPFVATRERPPDGSGTPDCTPRAPAPGATVCPGADTFAVIQDRIFASRCSLAACHGAALTGNLDLRPQAAHASLVGVLADNPVARASGKKRVAPGDAPASLLSQKVHGALAAGEGAPMPATGPALSDAETGLIDAWIDACAPATGKVPGAPCLAGEVYTPTAPLDPPPGGYQMVLEGPTLQPGEEQEGCLWVPWPNPTVPIKKVEVALNPGTHHFAVWRHNGNGVPPLGVWRPNDIACLASGAILGQSVAGAPGAPYFVAESPPGIASILPGGGYYGLNAHYYNEFDVPIQVRVWTNFHPYGPDEAPPAHYLQTITSLDASGRIRVPPYTQASLRGRWLNDSSRSRYILGVGGHMHKRGLRFRIWQSDGTQVLEDFDWAHPSYKGYQPPYEMRPGDWFDYECLHDNGVTRPVRRDAAGNPVTIGFGVSAEDEMCILTGSYYDD